MTDQTIEQLAREIVSQTGDYDSYSRALETAKLALLEGERRGMEKAAGIVAAELERGRDNLKRSPLDNYTRGEINAATQIAAAIRSAIPCQP